MNIKGKIPLLIIAALAWITIISSCANIGMPVGGAKDTIPPVLLGTSPELRALNYEGDEVRLTFNEYIQPDEITETLVVSPPLSQKPVVRTKSKTLIIDFNQELKDSTTYNLDFKNSIVDNNEKNPLKNLRFSFSTGPDYDSLRVAGHVVNAFNLEPLEKVLVLLQSNLHDSAVFKVIPDYIAKTDEQGFFMIDNIASGTYHLFAINDLNNDMKYNEGAEEIAFIDDLVVPSAEFHESQDTLVSGLDSMLILGHTHFYPDPFYLRYFSEDIFEQYIESSKRESRYKCEFIFNESVEDTFDIRLVGYENRDWSIREFNENMDSLTLWIADTTIAANDSLFMELSYFMLDSAKQLYVHKDTLLMKFTDPKIEEKKSRRKQEEGDPEVKEVPQFTWQIEMPATMELNGNISVQSPEPISSFDSTMVHLYLKEDTLKTPLPIRIEKDKKKFRTYLVSYEWEPETEYAFSIDSAACLNIYGLTSKAYSRSFKTREEDYYGSLTFTFSNVSGPMILQLLKNSDDEDVLKQQSFSENGNVTFNLLAPDKYRVKIIYDSNNNGKWDTGSYQDKLQPEKVGYINEVIKLRSNWSPTYMWDVTPDISFEKKIIDKEEEEKKRKEAEEKAKKEKESSQQNNMFRSGSSIEGGDL